MKMTKWSILFEDNHLLVVEKPVNIAVQEDSSGDPDLLTLLKQDLKERCHKPGNVYLGLVHRLDRPVGGVMVFAKTSKAASRLSNQIRTRQIRKQYLAVLCGRPQPACATLQDYLVKNEKRNLVHVASPREPGARAASLSYQLLEFRDGLSLVSIELQTGRPHQIRVQFSSRQWPLWGDQRYNPQAQPRQQIALWSWQLSLIHPVHHKEMVFTSNPPWRKPWNQMTTLTERRNCE